MVAVTPRISVKAGDPARFNRDVAVKINGLLAHTESKVNFPFLIAVAAPATPVEGQAYYDSTLHKARVWDGTTWQNLW